MTEIVRDGYRQMGETFDEWRDHIVGDPRDEWRDLLASKLEPGARILELGCGNGDDAHALALRGFRMTGVDLVARAEGVDVLEADFTELTLEPATFDAVASFYAFNHVPRERLAPLLRSIHEWLVPGGLVLTAFGVSDTAAWTGEWLGATMFFSSFPPEANSRLVRDAGFESLRDELVTFTEPEGEATFQWVLARSI
jgi:cyclopropane fatty-acyl-phospholipid synthase-like methyltransferase